MTTLTIHELHALTTYAVRGPEERVRYSLGNRGATEGVVEKGLITIGEPTAGITRTNIPHVTERGYALLDFMRKLPLPVSTITWALPDDK